MRARYARSGELERWLSDHKSYNLDYCLIWPFGRNSTGYGILTGRGYAHRIMCELAHGPAPDGYQAAHSCGRGADGCVNPLHLSWKTPRENQLDRIGHGDRWMGRRPRITEEQARAIISARGEETSSALAQRHGITEAAVRQIQTGKTWAWLHKTLRQDSNSALQSSDSK